MNTNTKINSTTVDKMGMLILCYIQAGATATLQSSAQVFNIYVVECKRKQAGWSTSPHLGMIFQNLDGDIGRLHTNFQFSATLGKIFLNFILKFWSFNNDKNGSFGIKIRTFLLRVYLYLHLKDHTQVRGVVHPASSYIQKCKC